MGQSNPDQPASTSKNNASLPNSLILPPQNVSLIAWNIKSGPYQGLIVEPNWDDVVGPLPAQQHLLPSSIYKTHQKECNWNQHKFEVSINGKQRDLQGSHFPQSHLNRKHTLNISFPGQVIDITHKFSPVRIIITCFHAMITSLETDASNNKGVVISTHLLINGQVGLCFISRRSKILAKRRRVKWV